MEDSQKISSNMYSDVFSQVYNLHWTDFLDIIGPKLLNSIRLKISENPEFEKHRILDLCCGTGKLANLLLTNGYSVLGIDLSPHMIKIAKNKNKEFLKTKQGEFRIDNATSYTSRNNFGICVSTFDSLNHMLNIEELEAVFRNVYRDLLDNGLFIFDLNTRKELEKWEFIDFEESDDLVLVFHGKYDKNSKRAYSRVYGFHKIKKDNWRRFDDLMINTIFEIAEVEKKLRETGFRNVWFTSEKDFGTKITDPETLPRVFIFAEK